tara:strand:- start:1494 stop:1907 length:414 start_codon:yes stop_codon:yes gene_type:complete
MDSDKLKKKYIAFRIAGQGGMWMYLYADSLRDVEAKFPEFYVFDKTPKSFNSGSELWAEQFTFDIDQPTGWLKDYFDNDQRHGYIYRNPDSKPEFVDNADEELVLKNPAPAKRLRWNYRKLVVISMLFFLIVYIVSQ